MKERILDFIKYLERIEGENKLDFIHKSSNS